MAEVRRTQNFGWKSEGKEPGARHRCKKEDNIKMNLKGIRWEIVD